VVRQVLEEPWGRHEGASSGQEVGAGSLVVVGGGERIGDRMFGAVMADGRFQEVRVGT